MFMGIDIHKINRSPRKNNIFFRIRSVYSNSIICIGYFSCSTNRTCFRCFVSLLHRSTYSCSPPFVSSSLRYRFVELYYHRSESIHKGQTIPARVETVVIYLPDVWSCLPTRLEWDNLLQSYQKQLEQELKADQELMDDNQPDEKAFFLFLICVYIKTRIGIIRCAVLQVIGASCHCLLSE